MPLPPWWSRSAIASSLPGWYACYVTLRKQLRSGVILRFKMDAIYVAEDEEGEEIHPNVEMIITNDGERPITIEDCICEYDCFRSASSKQQNRLSAKKHVDKKIANGESCRAYLLIYREPVKYQAIYAVDSTGKQWKPSKKEMAAFEVRSKKFWKTQGAP